MQPFPGFVGPSYTLRSTDLDAQRCVNLYPEMNEMGHGKDDAVAALVDCPGLLLFGTAGKGPHRGSWNASNNRAFVVSGAGLYEIDVNGAETLCGTLGSTAGPVSMADNGLQLMIVDGHGGYIFTFLDNSLASIDSDGFPIPTQVAFQDGYFIVNSKGTRQFFISSLYDGLTWDALDVAQKEGQADVLIALLSDHGQLLLGGDQTSEVWFNSGDADFPFARMNGAFLEHGVAAAETVRKLDNTVFWVGKDRNGKYLVWRLQQYQPTRVSTFAVEFALQSYGDISAATAFTYQSLGHSFYVLNCPDAKSSWVFDCATNLWHERAYLNGDGEFERHRAETHMAAFGKHLVGDYQNGNIYELSDEVYQDNGEPRKRMRRAPHLAANQSRVFHKKFALDMETGQGLPAVEHVNLLTISEPTVADASATTGTPTDVGESLPFSNVINFADALDVSDSCSFTIDLDAGDYVLSFYYSTNDGLTLDSHAMQVKFDALNAGVSPELATTTVDAKTGFVRVAFALTAGSGSHTIGIFKSGSFFTSQGFSFSGLQLEAGTVPTDYDPAPAEEIEPTIILRWSNDGCHTFGNEYERGIGKQGQYGKRVQWQKLGVARDRVYEVSTTANVRVAIAAAFLDVEAGRG